MSKSVNGKLQGQAALYLKSCYVTLSLCSGVLPSCLAQKIIIFRIFNQANLPCRLMGLIISGLYNWLQWILYQVYHTQNIKVYYPFLTLIYFPVAQVRTSCAPHISSQWRTRRVWWWCSSLTSITSWTKAAVTHWRDSTTPHHLKLTNVSKVKKNRLEARRLVQVDMTFESLYSLILALLAEENIYSYTIFLLFLFLHLLHVPVAI